ncbi:MAG: hypothetical protein CL868_10755 [Cytophagaceae bacterium]|nr:hypothetical protein [Cytophagaceae bacterium]|tara:strand:+ start:3414 stop:3803 length:390 start_codon:yes stop_codon:yes gene_type:complete
MTTNFKNIKISTSEIRASFNQKEIEGTLSFINHMNNQGYSYSIHSFISNNISKFANDGFLAMNSENPSVGVLFVKTIVSRKFLRKKIRYRMYIIPYADMDSIHSNYKVYKQYFQSFEDFSGYRDNSKLN